VVSGRGEFWTRTVGCKGKVSRIKEARPIEREKKSEVDDIVPTEWVAGLRVTCHGFEG
jgi:hypothetical protein